MKHQGIYLIKEEKQGKDKYQAGARSSWPDNRGTPTDEPSKSGGLPNINYTP
jgi:hypothetical protein